MARRGAGEGLRLPPCPEGVPVLGNVHQLGSVPHRSLHNMARWHGPVMLIRLGAVWAVVVSSAAAARDVTRTHDDHCCSRPASLGSARLSYGNKSIIFSPCSAYWREMRGLFAFQLLDAGGVGVAWDARREQVERLMAVLGDAVTAAALVEMDVHVFRVVDGIIGAVAYGGVHGAEAEWFQLHGEVMIVASRISAKDLFSNATGRLVDRLTGITAQRERVFVKLDAFFEAVLERHLDPARPKLESGGGDLVDALLGICEEMDLTRDHVKAVLLDAFLGGGDTSYATVMWAMSELVRSPRVLKKAQEEVRAAVATGDEQLSDLPKLTYLKMVVKEMLRLHPPATLLVPRETLQRVEIGGYDVPAGTRLLVNAWAIGRDPAVWGEDAEEFEPERFEAGGRHGNVDFRDTHLELMPFGTGRRICPGLAMGVANVEFILVSLLCAFYWALTEGVKAEDMSMEEAGGVIFLRKTPLELLPCRPRAG